MAKGWIKTIVGWLVIFATIGGIGAALHIRDGDMERFMPIGVPLGLSVWLVVTILLSSGALGRRFFASLLVCAYQLIVIMTCHVLRYRMRPEWLSTFLACLVVFAMGSFAIWWVIRRIHRMPQTVNFLTLNIAIVLLVMMIYANGIYPIFVPMATWQMTMPFAVSVLVLISFFPVAFYLSEKTLATERLARIADNTEVLFAELRSARAIEEGSRRVRHDMRHHVSVAHEMLASGRVKEADEYLLNMTGQGLLGSTGSRRWCENSLVDALYAVADRKSAANGKGFNGTVDVPAALPLAELDMVALLGNMLENAILYGEPGEVRASVTLDHGGILRLSVSNCVPSGFELVNGLPTASEGIGLTSIRKVVEKHHGVMGFDVHGNELVCKVVIGCG